MAFSRHEEMHFSAYVGRLARRNEGLTWECGWVSWGAAGQGEEKWGILRVRERTQKIQHDCVLCVHSTVQKGGIKICAHGF